MRKPVLILIALGSIAAGTWFLFFKNGKKEEGPKQQPLTMNENTGVFNQSFDQLLTAYFAVKDALVASDTVKTNGAAALLLLAADSLKMDEINGDSSGVIKATAQNFAGTISVSAKALALESTIDAKRKEFEIITDAMWSLTRTVKYSGRKVYYQYCPMAFDNKGAYWMSADREIRNPYFGDKMLECGSVEDSLDYANK